MRTTPHRITTPHTDDLHNNPYDELAALADNPLDEFLHDDYDDSADDDDWSPPNHRRGTRRRNRPRSLKGTGGAPLAGLPLAAKILVLALALTAFLALGDRWAVLYAEHEAAAKLKETMHLSAAPEVDIDGFPFLTQVLDDRLHSVRITVPDVAADRVSLAKVSTTATDIRIVGGLLDFKGAEIGSMNGEVLLSFDDLGRELGASQVTFSARGHDRVIARGTLPVAGHDLRLSAEARIQRSGTHGISTRIGEMRLDIGDLATFRPGTRPSDGLHLSRKAAADIRTQTTKVKALFKIPAIVDRLGVPRSVVRAALHNERKLAELTGTPRFLDSLVKVNLIDLAVDHPWLLKKLGLDPALLNSLAHLTKPQLADQLSLGFQLPKLPGAGDVRLRDVTVRGEGIRVRLEGSGISFGK